MAASLLTLFTLRAAFNCPPAPEPPDTFAAREGRLAPAVFGHAAADYEKDRLDCLVRQAGQLGRVRGGKIGREVVNQEAEPVLRNFRTLVVATTPSHLGLLEEELDELPATLTVTTGNGRHLYLRAAEGVSGSGVGLWGGIDVKAGGGSYVVAPPSVHKSRRAYAWETVGEPEELPEAWVYAMADGKPAKAKTGAVRGRVHSGIRRRVQLPKFLTPDYVIHKGYRNDTLFAFASRERGRGASCQRVLEVTTEINGTYCREPLTAAELERIAASACKYPTNAEKLASRNGQAAA